MDFNVIMYIILGAVAVAGGIILVMARHPIRGALGLLLTMLSLAGMYAILAAHAIAVFQVIIYAGAIMVLIIYIIMLLDIRSEDFGRVFSPFFYVGAPIILILVGFFIYRLFDFGVGASNDFTALSASKMPLAKEFGSVSEIGSSLLKKYVFPFEYVSTLLFAAIVAVIAIVQLDWKGRNKS
ncbi:NADH-quinone oxidoreductase subunit J [candidate division KSB1 bacterium]|nr:NADH-quinone oxidoreductase subunit J [candidate division KSB1 bacterium]